LLIDELRDVSVSSFSLGLANVPTALYSKASGTSKRAVLRVPAGAEAALRSETLMKFRRITVDPKQMGGMPCIRGLRVPVATVVGMMADGMTIKDILAAYPDLEGDDIQEALRYAADAVRERELPLTIP
jgi:uncharacterized protein (DUF433 family)